MARARVYRLVYDPKALDHVRAIHRKFHSMIRDRIKGQLSRQPNVETRNRKPLSRPSWIAPAWELRFGPDNRFRVFYRVDEGASVVQVLAVGEKKGNVLSVGGKEFRV